MILAIDLKKQKLYQRFFFVKLFVIIINLYKKAVAKKRAGLLYRGVLVPKEQDYWGV